MIDLWVARHPPVVAVGICYGRTDVEACISPEEACEILAVEPMSPAVVWSSPSSRCRLVAARWAARIGAELHVDPDLHELDFGAFEGRRWSDLEREDAFQTWAEDWEKRAPPNGETTRDLEARVRRWIEKSSQPVMGSGALIAHAGVVRALEVIVRHRTWPEVMRESIEHLRWRRFVA